MRKYILNPGIITAVAGVLPLIRNTTASKSKLRTLAAWAAWAGTVTAAVAAVREASIREQDHEVELKKSRRK